MAMSAVELPQSLNADGTVRSQSTELWFEVLASIDLRNNGVTKVPHDILTS